MYDGLHMIKVCQFLILWAMYTVMVITMLAIMQGRNRYSSSRAEVVHTLGLARMRSGPISRINVEGCGARSRSAHRW